MLNNKKNNIQFLLENDLSSFYWIGFILADGCIYKNKIIKISISSEDIGHLSKFCKLSKSNIVLGTSTTGYKPGSTYCATYCFDKILVPLIQEKFDIKSRKTYNPPNFSKYNFTNDQMLSLIIGFIDGDGCIVHNKNDNTQHIILNNHSSWLENLKYINTKLHTYFKLLETNKVYLQPANMVKVTIGKYDITRGLKHFIHENNLPALERKWDKVPFTRNKHIIFGNIPPKNPYVSQNALTINGIHFKSISDAARYYNCKRDTIKRNYLNS